MSVEGDSATSVHTVSTIGPGSGVGSTPGAGVPGVATGVPPGATPIEVDVGGGVAVCGTALPGDSRPHPASNTTTPSIMAKNLNFRITVFLTPVDPQQPAPTFPAMLSGVGLI